MWRVRTGTREAGEVLEISWLIGGKGAPSTVYSPQGWSLLFRWIQRIVSISHEENDLSGVGAARAFSREQVRALSTSMLHLIRDRSSAFGILILGNRSHVDAMDVDEQSISALSTVAHKASVDLRRTLGEALPTRPRFLQRVAPPSPLTPLILEFQKRDDIFSASRPPLGPAAGVSSHKKFDRLRRLRGAAIERLAASSPPSNNSSLLFMMFHLLDFLLWCSRFRSVVRGRSDFPVPNRCRCDHRRSLQTQDGAHLARSSEDHSVGIGSY